jgi:hypothetical protein
VFPAVRGRPTPFWAAGAFGRFFALSTGVALLPSAVARYDRRGLQRPFPMQLGPTDRRGPPGRGSGDTSSPRNPRSTDSVTSPRRRLPNHRRRLPNRRRRLPHRRRRSPNRRPPLAIRHRGQSCSVQLSAMTTVVLLPHSPSYSSTSPERRQSRSVRRIRRWDLCIGFPCSNSACRSRVPCNLCPGKPGSLCLRQRGHWQRA